MENLIQFLTLENIYYVLGVFLIIIIILLIWNIRLEIKTKKLMRGKSGASLESTFIEMQKDIDGLENFKKEMLDYLRVVEKGLRRSVQGVENINFNAFSGAESGGKSFATAFLNENGDGVIISSLHARDRINIFTKKVKHYKSDIELSEEENHVLIKVKEILDNK